MKKIAILGSTGSIGRQTLEVIDRFPDRFEVISLTAGANLDLLAEQARKYRPRLVSIARAEDVQVLRSQIPGSTAVSSGLDGMVEAVLQDEVNLVVTSVTGTIGLVPTLAAISKGRDIALANKETLVAAGELVMTSARNHGVRILPVDSEHSAIFQCLQGQAGAAVRRLLLTASGGPFWRYSATDLRTVTKAEALKHPNWSMGRKISVDSATMMNKGLEVLEARWLFDVNLDQIEVLVHPQSIVHSMVEFGDGSVLAQLGLPDMRIPVQYALSFPDRWENDLPKMDLLKIGQLAFEKPRLDVFPGLELAYAAGRTGGTMPAVMNAANEEAVRLFLNGDLKFTEIPELVEKVMNRHRVLPKPGLAEILASDGWAREEAAGLKRS